MEINRLMWGSRRGMLELDLILQPFVERVYPNLPLEDQQRFQNLLAEQDQDLFAWFLHRDLPADPDLQRIVKIVREHTGVSAQP